MSWCRLFHARRALGPSGRHTGGRDEGHGSAARSRYEAYFCSKVSMGSSWNTNSLDDMFDRSVARHRRCELVSLAGTPPASTGLDSTWRAATKRSRHLGNGRLVMAARQDGYEDFSSAGSGPRPGSVEAELELSYHRLADTAARVFRLLPVNPGPDMSTAAAAVLADLSVSEVRGVLAGLAQASLVEAASGSRGRWWMHDLVRRYAQQLSDAYAKADGRERARDRLIDYYLNMAEAADDYLRALPGMDVPAEFSSRDSALAWLDAELACLTATAQMAADTGRDRAAASLPLLLAQYLAERRRFDDLLAVTTIGLTAARRLGDREGEGDALNNLGGALLEVHQLEKAITACQDAATIFRETGDLRGEGDALNNLGLALKGTRRLDESIAAHQDAATIYRETGDRHGEAKALSNLGGALRESGRPEEAVSAWQDAAALFRETGDQRGQGVALRNAEQVLVCGACGAERLS
jgi:tetratricopeptide (TPR) repeat protein